MKHSHNSGRIAGMFSVLLGLSAVSSANPHIEPQPRRIQSAAAVEAAIRDPHAAGDILGFGHEMLCLWDGRRDLLVEAARGKNEYLGRCAMFGLAALGDKDAQTVVTGILADSTRSFDRRLAAAEALSWMGDIDPLSRGLLDRFCREAGRHGRVYRAAAELALKRARRPDMQRPLIAMGPRFLEFRFLIDDIATVYVLENPVAFASSGVIYSEDRSHEKSRHVFRPDEYRRICDLLQEGEADTAQMLSYDEYLVFELKDGRQMAITRSGSRFWAHNSDTGDLTPPWFCVRNDSLAQFLDGARGR